MRLSNAFYNVHCRGEIPTVKAGDHCLISENLPLLPEPFLFTYSGNCVTRKMGNYNRLQAPNGIKFHYNVFFDGLA